MTKHTPGPWGVSYSTRSLVFKQGTNEQMAGCYGDNAQANARLIAAAPDLLEALQFVMSAHGEQLDLAFEQASAAIAKATGGQP